MEENEVKTEEKNDIKQEWKVFFEKEVETNGVLISAIAIVMVALVLGIILSWVGVAIIAVLVVVGIFTVLSWVKTVPKNKEG